MTVLEPTGGEITERTNYQVLKKGKPYSKMATNDYSPRMTREAYFKIAEVRNLSSMRDDMVSILGSSVMTSAQHPTTGLQTRLSNLADQSMMRKTVQLRDSKHSDHATA